MIAAIRIGSVEAPMKSNLPEPQGAFAIFTRTICEGLVPAWYDARGYPVVYPTERDAQREIVDSMIIALEQFLEGEREFDDAVVCEDFVLPVAVWPDGTICLEDGRWFGRRPC